MFLSLFKPKDLNLQLKGPYMTNTTGLKACLEAGSEDNLQSLHFAWLSKQSGLDDVQSDLDTSTKIFVQQWALG